MVSVFELAWSEVQRLHGLPSALEETDTGSVNSKTVYILSTFE